MPYISGGIFNRFGATFGGTEGHQRCAPLQENVGLIWECNNNPGLGTSRNGPTDHRNQGCERGAA